MVLGQLVFITLPAAPSKQDLLELKAFAYLASPIVLCFLGGCVAPLAALSSSGTAAASSVGAVAVANPSTAASLASTATTGKSPLEHAASAATKKECSFFNIIDAKPICIEMVLPPITDKSEPFLGPADTSPALGKQ